MALLWASAFLWMCCIHLAEGSDQSYAIEEGTCNERRNKNFPYRGMCGKYLECDEYGSATIKVCEPTTSNFNWLTEKCDNDTICRDDKNVYFQAWSNLTPYQQSQLKEGKMPQKPVLLQEVKDTLTVFDQSSKCPNCTSLLTTYFLAREDGLHNFTSNCKQWCRVWIKTINGDCKKIPVLEQTHLDPFSNSEYKYNNPVKLMFGHYYLLEVVHFGNGATRLLDIKVSWQKKKLWIPFDNIAKERLNLNVTENCTTQSTIRPSTTENSTQSQKPTPKLSSRLPSMVLSSTVFPSTVLSSTVFPSTVLSSTAFPSTTLITLPTKESSESDVKNLAANISNFLAAMNTTQGPSSSKQKQESEGMTQLIYVDQRGEFIAQRWNKRGESLNISRKNVVMEVSFPVNNYSFPRPGFSLEKKYETRSDQIFIPAHALVNSSGGFSRRMFSALYLNLKEKLPQYFNSVESDGNKTSGVYELNSKVIASTAVPRIGGLATYDIVIHLAHLKTNFSKDTKLLCAFYKWRGSKTDSGVWSTEGCFRDEEMSTGNFSVCRCNHLTHFGILMQMTEMKISQKDAKALRLISYIGCALSLVGASLTVLAIACLPGARSHRTFIHVNLASAIAFAQITFLAGIDETENKTVCTIVAALLHYFLLAAFSWMLFEGIFLHILIVKVFHDQLPKKRYYVTFCWGLPGLIVLLASNLLRDGYGTETSCWLSTEKLTIWTFMGPAIVVITINVIILCKVMKEIGSLRTSGRREMTVRTVRDGFRSAVILLPLLGITWALGLICVNGSPIIFQYLFAIFNSLQGLFIFLFHCLFNSEVRKAFWRKVDLWFTTHHAFGSHGHSPSCSKKSKDDHSFSCATNNKTSKGNSTHENGYSRHTNEDASDPTRRKISSVTTSSYVDSWSPKPVSDSESTIRGITGRFSPTLADINDLKYGFVPFYKEPDNLKKTLSTPALGMPPKASEEDLNGNTHSLDDIRTMQNALNQRNGIKALPKIIEPAPIAKNCYPVVVGIGGEPANSVKQITERFEKNRMRIMGISEDGNDKTNGTGRTNGIVLSVPVDANETKL